MTLDPRFIVASDLQEYFVDKDSGAPLAAGVVTFYEDASRTTLKPIYRISGSFPSYTYTQLANPVTLSTVGTFQDPNTGDDIVPYYFPYDGIPSASMGTPDLYYITVYSAAGVLQFTRQAWPNVSSSSSGATVDFTNYIPNGQFLAHNNVPANILANPPTIAGQITQASTIVAQGGWTFERPSNSTATDIVTFTPFNSYVTNPNGSPKFAITINNEVPNAGDTFKDLRIKFTDVNKFASDTQQYTFAFPGISNTGSALSATVYLIKNFGSGGSASTTTSLGTITIPAGSYSVIQTTFTFGNNTGQTIGSGDYLQLAIRFPTNSGFNVSLTDFVLTPGSTIITKFPTTPDSKFSYQSITAPIPAPDGSNLFLLPRLTMTGWTYDDSQISDLVMETSPVAYVNSLHPTTNRMLADGNQYLSTGYSPLGIPFKRLQQKYWNSTINCPIYGTGKNYVTATILNNTAIIGLATNTINSATNTADGAVPTNFTFATAHTGASYNYAAYRNGANTLLAICNTEGANNFGTGNSGFGFSFPNAPYANRRSSAIITTSASSGLASKYFTFANNTTSYYMWFKVDGAGTDPAPGGTGIEVDLLSSFSANDVCLYVLQAMSGNQLTTITCGAGSTVTAGSYFTFNSPSAQFYAYYVVNGSGTDPNLSGKIAVQVQINSTDTAAQVASKTQIAINSLYFASPKVQGLFPRFYDPNSNWDPNAATRFSLTPNFFGNNIGCIELDDTGSHAHTFTNASVNNSTQIWNSGGGAQWTLVYTNTSTGTTPDQFSGFGSETRGINMFLNAAILY